MKDLRGSGSDKNSDTRRLRNPENFQDKMAEDTFPASDAPSTTPLTGIGDRPSYGNANDFSGTSDEEEAESTDFSQKYGLPKNFKDDPKAQFEYGRESQRKTHHFDQTSRRLEHGNPDVGDIDLGTIEADRPAQPDDHDHYDSADDDESGTHREF